MTRELGVRITAMLPRNPFLSFKLIGTDKVSGGAGGWEEVSRKLREPLLVWTARPLYTYVLPLRMDRFLAEWEHTVEGDIRSLQHWASSGRRTDREHNPPARVRLSGNVRTPLSTQWVITDLDWGDFITNAAGERIQQDVTVTLKEYPPTDEKGYAEALKSALGEDTATTK